MAKYFFLQCNIFTKSYHSLLCRDNNK